MALIVLRETFKNNELLKNSSTVITHDVGIHLLTSVLTNVLGPLILQTFDRLGSSL